MVHNDGQLAERAAAIGEGLLARGERLATAESCTGGWLAKALTDIAGSSRWFERGLVTYSNAAKAELLGVAQGLIERDGAVSAAVAEAMAAGARARCPVEWAVAVTGIAGPDGGSAEKPVGTVWIAWALPDGSVASRHYRFDGDREAVRRASVAAALDGLLDGLGRQRA